MAGDMTVDIVGNLTADPELRFTDTGVAVANFTVANTPRIFDARLGEWRDSGDTLFLRCSIWRDAAENVAESLRRGTRVVGKGRLKQRSYTDKDGVNRTVIEAEVDEIGPSTRWSATTVNKVERSSGANDDSPWQASTPRSALVGVSAGQPPF
ncbi:single-stranded DNA-binding protein [Kibdelosporangium phytohabitans]|uniref:Single-stranded DNA-binding protein n=1 Tax=Kibdelosporangium phytohabitans TaxID=860235 RepID=A0A0N7F2N7_9PSEU|nr:single-stranded DNA-binding protein [Kibdelosporangium phytohabitans]ALG06343.1 single-stranded DNA-binding protein [Kibdelosporangium phytohabitans]